MTPKYSIIICTRNRSESLGKTLASLIHIEIPASIENELLVIDNGSTDNTKDVVKNYLHPLITTRYIHEPKPGLSNARNRGLSEAKGEILFFIDDDVRLSNAWLINMLGKFDDNIDAVSGAVKLPEELLRPWMTSTHRKKLASTEGINPDNPKELIGANMAFRKYVLDQIPQFDPELGAGALGFGEETLFSLQLIEEKYTIGFAENATVTHYFDVQRLQRRDWIQGAKKRGQTKSYIDYHWKHKNINNLYKNLIKSIYHLYTWRITHLSDVFMKEKCSENEIGLIQRVAYYRYYLILRKIPRKYSYLGLVKII